MQQFNTIKPSQLEAYIDWPHFFHAWQIKAKDVHTAEAQALKDEALKLLRRLDGDATLIKSKCIVVDAYGKNEDIVLAHNNQTLTLPCLRQQHRSSELQPHNLCLADFLAPTPGNHPIGNRLGLFATAVHAPALTSEHDEFMRLLLQTLADRMAEAEAERLHRLVLQSEWGYRDSGAAKLPGCRPAIGYPSLPDMSLNFLLASILDFKELGITLTESGMMIPHAAVSGLIFAHPQAAYFNISHISETQFADYAQRRNLPEEVMRKFLANLL